MFTYMYMYIIVFLYINLSDSYNVPDRSSVKFSPISFSNALDLTKVESVEDLERYEDDIANDNNLFKVK